MWSRNLLAVCTVGFGAVAWADSLTATLQSIGPHLVLDFAAKKSSDVPISSSSDQIYIWNEDEHGYRYYMVGQGVGRRENLWIGVGHSENTEQDYLMVAIRNIEGQFGKFFPQDLVRTFDLNGVSNPGRLGDGGFGIYPEREVTEGLPSGVASLFLSTSMYELGTNHFYFRINLQPGAFRLRDFSDASIAVSGDGQLRVKLTQNELR